MATAQQKTRKQIRQSVGLLTGKIWQDAGALQSSPSETAPSAGKLIDQNLAFGAEDEHRGKWAFATDSNSSVEQRRVLSSSPDERSFTVSVAFSRAPDTGWVYELWEPDLSPLVVHEFIDQAITEATRKGSVPFTSDSMHTGGGISAWGLSSDFAGVRFVEWRRSYAGQQLASLNTLMSSQGGATIGLDSADKRFGSHSNTVRSATAAGSATTLAISSFTTTNLSGYTHLEFWIKPSVSFNSSNYVAQLSEGSTAIEIGLPIQAVNADSWTRVTLPLNNPELDSAVTSFELRTGSSNQSTNTIHLDDVITYRARAEEWITIPREFWELDKDRRELRIKPNAGVPYAKLQVTGVKKPALLTTDTQISDIDPQYVINSATAKVFRLLGDMGQSDRYEQLAQRQRVAMHTPSNIKWLDNA